MTMEKEIAQDAPSNAPSPLLEATHDAADTRQLATRLVRDRSPHRTARRARKGIGLLVVLLAAVAGYFVWQAWRPLPVDVAVVAYQRTGAAARPIVRLSGYVTYPRNVTVAATSRNPVVRLGFVEGERVRQGAVLATFDNSELLAQQKAQEVSLQDARATLQRTENLHAAGAASDADLQRAQTAVASIEAALDVVKTQLDDTVVRAPFAGLITQKLVEVGEVAAQGVCLMIDDSITLVQVDVNQEDIAKVSPEQPAVVTLDAYPDLEYAARVYQIMPTADQAKNTVQVKVQILQPDAKFRPQLSAKVFFVDQPQAGNQPVSAVLAVDTSAVMQEEGKTWVWQIEQGKAVRREVRTGQVLDDQVEVTAGLKADDRVVANAAQYHLSEGDRVTAKQAQ